jgi:hypothetical protein
MGNNGVLHLGDDCEDEKKLLDLEIATKGTESILLNMGRRGG